MKNYELRSVRNPAIEFECAGKIVTSEVMKDVKQHPNFGDPFLFMEIVSRALQWSGNPHGIGYGVEMDGNWAQFVKIIWIGLDLGQTVDLKRYDRYRTFTKHDISITETRFYRNNAPVIDKYVPKLKD